MKSRVSLFGLIIVIIIFYIAGCRNAGEWLVKEDEPVEADAIVILMGSITDRVLQAADLYSEGVAREVIMVETRMPSNDLALKERGVYTLSNTKQSKRALLKMSVPADSIKILPGGANSTQEEAEIVREYLKGNHNIDTLILVSSSEHMRRASMIFNSAFNKYEMPVHVVSIPSEYSKFNSERWWKRREDVKAVVMEYLKIGNFILFEWRKL